MSYDELVRSKKKKDNKRKSKWRFKAKVKRIQRDNITLKNRDVFGSAFCPHTHSNFLHH